MRPSGVVNMVNENCWINFDPGPEGQEFRVGSTQMRCTFDIVWIFPTRMQSWQKKV